MKIKLILIALTIGMVSCTKQNVPSTTTTFVLKDGNGTLEIVVIDSCEYLFGPWGNATVLTHKGNCKNSTHKGSN